MSEPTGRYYAPGQGPMPGQPGYGEPVPYQQQQYWAPQSFGPPPKPSGATVITGAVVQIVQSAFFVLVALALIFLADLVNSAGDEFGRRSGADVSRTTDAISRWVAVAGVLLLACAVFMIVLAALAIHGRRWAAITSVVLQSLAAVFIVLGLVRSDATQSPAPAILFLLASIGVIVLFLIPASTEYFAAKSRR